MDAALSRGGLILTLAAALALGAAVAIRLWPVPDGWHEDPGAVVPPRAANHWLMRDGAAAPALRLALPPDAVADRLAAVAAATPRTRRIGGEGLWTTWLTRSRLIGWPDTTSVLIRPNGAGSEVLVYARSRLSGYDWGVNRARAEAWAVALAAP
jgi:uncharacterized protein (DUF1499 family)